MIAPPFNFWERFQLTAEAAQGRRRGGDDGRSDSYARVGYRLPCFRLGAILGLEDGPSGQGSARQLATGVPLHGLAPDLRSWSGHW